MSKREDRLRAQAAYDRDQDVAMNQRPDEPVAPPPFADRPSWASDCAGWRVGVHERTKENRLAGIYKCKWCGQTFDPPTEAELDIMRQRNLAYQRPQRMRRGKW